MSGLLKELLRKDSTTIDLWQGYVVSSPTDLSDRLSVVVPDFDTQFVWDNCRWQSRDATSMPAPGDACLLVLDNRQEPWVLSWWPFA